MRGYQHHRRPSRFSWYSLCQHHRGAEWLAEFHTLVKASEQLLWACPRNASLTTASVTATDREQERKSGKGNTVIKSEDVEVSNAAALTT